MTSARRGLLVLTVLVALQTAVSCRYAQGPMRSPVLTTHPFWYGMLGTFPLFWSSIGVFGPGRTAYRLPATLLVALWLSACYTFRYSLRDEQSSMALTLLQFGLFQVVGWPLRFVFGFKMVYADSAAVVMDERSARWSLRHLFSLTAGIAIVCFLWRRLHLTMQGIPAEALMDIALIGCMAACLAARPAALLFGLAAAAIATSFLVLGGDYFAMISLDFSYAAGFLVNAVIGFLLIRAGGLRLTSPSRPSVAAMSTD